MRFVGPNPLFAGMNPSSDWRLSSYFLFVVWLPLAGVAELADALDSKSSDRKIVWVRSPPPAGSSLFSFSFYRQR